LGVFLGGPLRGIFIPRRLGYIPGGPTFWAYSSPDGLGYVLGGARLGYIHPPTAWVYSWGGLLRGIFIP